MEVDRCPKCGAVEIVIPRIEELHRALALAILRKRGRLAAPEVRFLRKYLGWSGADFAKHMGVDAATVSRWENEEQPMGPVADRLLRLMVVTREPVKDYSLDDLIDAARKAARPIRLSMTIRGGRWRAAGARAA